MGENKANAAPAKHFIKRSREEYEFNQLAAEITIIDGRGRIIWRKRRGMDSAPIRWTGQDLVGTPVDVGSYTCKIMYAHLPREVYLPFVFMR